MKSFSARRMLRDLVGMMKADKRESETENIFLSRLAILMGLSEEDLAEAQSLPIGQELPTSEFDRILQFHRLVLLMNIDLENDKTELDFLLNLVPRMGLRPESAEMILDEMRKNPRQIIAPEKLIEIFRRIHN